MLLLMQFLDLIIQCFALIAAECLINWNILLLCHNFDYSPYIALNSIVLFHKCSQSRYLDADVLSYRQAPYADSTKNTYNAQRRAFLRFCLYFSLSPVPVTSNNLCKYAAFLARSLSPSIIPGYLNHSHYAP